MKLIPYAYGAGIRNSDLNAEELDLAIRKKMLEQELDVVNGKISEVTTAVSSFISVLDGVFSLLVKEVNELESQAQLERQALSEEYLNDTYPDDLLHPDEIEMMRQHLEENKKRNEAMSEASIKTKKPSKGSKRLYALISRMCHPDKIKEDDPKHELKVKIFIEAKAAYLIDAYLRLQELHKCASLEMSWNAMRLQDSIKELDSSLQRARTILLNLESQYETQLYLAYRENPTASSQVVSAYRKSLVERKRQASELLKRIKARKVK